MTTIDLIKFTLKVATLSTRPTNRETSRDEELEEASEQS
jgi:hypothetical protein